MMKKYLYILILFSWLAYLVPAADRYVVPNGAGSKNGLDWDNAYSNIQDAVADCSGVNDRIFLKAGTYVISAQVTVSNRPGLLIKGGMLGNTPLPGDLDG